ncbi:hypothetical protein [Geothrix edaphica]|uniref:hypothetical protein n=1 Tax=Geothrix edaphica TaxID=2927976 RepID=UPI002552CFAF|nr:hypothetical protein [Geothrix edaphica]
MQQYRVFVVFGISLALFHCGQPLTTQPRTPPIPSSSASSLSIKPESMIYFFRDSYTHPNDPIAVNTFSQQSAFTLGYARVKISVGLDGRISKSELIESNGHMWRLIGRSIYKLEFRPNDATEPGPWDVEIYFSARQPDPSHAPQGKDSSPFLKTEGEIGLTILSVTPKP